MSIRVLKPGLLTTVQDLGRAGLQKFGVVAGGAMDVFALRAANLLTGNAEGEAVLEMTVMGPSLSFAEDTLIAVCGGDLSPAIDGQPVPLWRAVRVRGGSTLRFGAARNGSRGYLAVAGGFDIAEEMNSRSTYLRAGIGGFQGRALREGDELGLRPRAALSEAVFMNLSRIDKDAPFIASPRAVSKHVLPDYSPQPLIRVLKGVQYDLFDEDSRELFFTSAFKVSPQSDRMGYRLTGPGLALRERQEMISEAVTFGTVQVPADGNPIVLMADRQTTGGYPKIAQVISVDLPVMAQLNIGAEVYFEEVTLEEAQELYLIRETELQLLKQGIRMNNPYRG